MIHGHTYVCHVLERFLVLQRPDCSRAKEAKVRGTLVLLIQPAEEGAFSCDLGASAGWKSTCTVPSHVVFLPLSNLAPSVPHRAGRKNH